MFPDHVAIIHGELHQAYRDFFKRSRQLASALSAASISRGDRVSAMLANTLAMLIVYDDVQYTGERVRHTAIDYEVFLTHGDEAFVWQMPADEWDAIAINYTSGTTGDPKVLSPITGVLICWPKVMHLPNIK